MILLELQRKFYGIITMIPIQIRKSGNEIKIKGIMVYDPLDLRKKR